MSEIAPFTRPTLGAVEDRDRPTAGDLEQRAAPTAAPTVEGRRLRGLIPYRVESRDLGGWREVIEPGALRGARMDDLVATVDHGGVPIGRHPGTLTLDDRADGLAWSLELPESRSDVREAVERGDLCAGSWRMVVARDEWRGNVRHVHEVAELRDVSVVSNPAYAASVVEHRSAPEHRPAPAGPTPGPPQRVGGLRVEDRAASSDPATVEARVMDALRSIQKGEARSLNTTTASPVAPDEQGTFLWDKLRAASVMLAAGVRVIPTSRETVVWPRLTSDVAPDWYAEEAPITPGDPGFGTLSATPHKLAHLVVLSNEVIDDSEPSIVEVVNSHLLTMLALRLDASMLIGNPASNAASIRGLKYQAGIQTISMGTNGAQLTNYDPFVRAVGLLRDANVPPPYAALLHTRDLTALELLKELTGSSQQLAAPAGLPPFFTTTQLPVNETKGTATTASSAYVFAPAELVLVRRYDAVIELDRSRLFNSDQSEMRGKARADLVLPNPQAVVRIDGIIP